ncbi:heparan-alpha-glucosaminide N-acetyltransferase-like isoform X2 [Ruditapes philippinarum]|uniref:heparan-alpha-glucosaminide N-acetyltransferase-like isoform X2 n=1 Tax=Ruditapes philippinarum TaxID=129788 RepID=UPI00295A749E|nr:heparan-alpha-glucosaminide N-acetyltransferase-like isoform X2 [Ruditapes philippinarum]
MDDRGKSNVKTFYFICLLICFCLCDDGKDPKNVCKHVPQKKINTAFLSVITHGHNSQNVTVNLNTITSECYTCDLQLTALIDTHHNMCTVLVDTRWKMKVSISSKHKNVNVSSSCGVDRLSNWFIEGGNYSIIVMIDGLKVQCDKLVRQNDPWDSNIPIYVAIGSFVGLILLWWFLKYLYRTHLLRRLQSYFRSDNAAFIDPVAKGNAIKGDFDAIKEIEKPISLTKGYNLRRRKNAKSILVPSKNDYAEQDLGVPTNTSEEDALRPRKERLKSLDTFRGISIVLMIFVNYRGGDYWFFRHSKWNGLTVADIVFPWFVWIMGTAMAYSFHSQLRRSTPKTRMFWKIFKRSCILFLLGLLINSSDGLNPVRMREFRIPGVLQRFAGTYLIVATLHMFFAKPNDPNQYTWWSPIRDITDYWFEWLFNIILVTIWLAITFGLPVPGCPRGYLGPGGLANDGDGKNVSLCTGGAASYIDRTIFGEGRIYQSPTCKEIYHSTVPHDPEGLLGILTSCFMCFLGLQAGKILRTFPDWKARVKRFIIWGIILGVIAVALCKGEKNGGYIPINKNLWSLSFVICLSCFAFFLFTFCYITIDVYQIWSGAPFYYPGRNSIFMYVAHLVLLPYFPVSIYVDETSHWAQLAMNLWGPSFWCLVTYYMHQKLIFYTI